jgi:hypothetical protein
MKGFEGTPIPVNINTGVLTMTKDNIDAMLKAAEELNK